MTTHPSDSLPTAAAFSSTAPLFSANILIALVSTALVAGLNTQPPRLSFALVPTALVAGLNTQPPRLPTKPPRSRDDSK